MGVFNFVRPRKQVNASRAGTGAEAASKFSGSSVSTNDDDWDQPSRTVYGSKLSDSEQMAKSAAQTGKEMASRAEWDKTPEGKSHNEAQAWAAKDRDSKSLSGGIGGGMQTQSSNIYNQRG